MAYKDTDEFKNSTIMFNTLAAEVENISALIKAANDNKLSLYNHLIISIVNFDDHLKKMIKDFPEYYDDCKEVLDNMFVQNSLFMEATFKEIKKLNPLEN